MNKNHKHIFDSEEFNPHCHECGKLMRDDSIKTERWEEEFDSEFPMILYSGSGGGSKDIKDFIKKVIVEREDEIIREIEKMKLPVPNPYGTTVKVERVNMIIDKIIEIIKKA